jgi:hypothetical protein
MSWAGIRRSRPTYSSLGRRSTAADPGWAGTSLPPAGPSPPASSPGQAFRPAPGWASSSSPGWAGRPPASRPAPFPGRASAPRPAFLRAPGWAGRQHSPGWAGAIFRQASRLGRLPPVPAGPASPPGRDSSSRPQAALCRLGRFRPAGPVSFISRLGQTGIPLAQAGIPLIRPSYSSPGQDLPPLAYNIYPGSTPAHCVSPGTPPGSDWHFLHRRMLVLGRPLAQTSISLLS